MNILNIIAKTRHAVPRVLPLMRDARVPLWLKGAAVVLALLIVSPLDLLGDIPFLGLVDDVTLLALVSTLFVRLGERAVRRAGAPATYDGEVVTAANA